MSPIAVLTRLYPFLQPFRKWVLYSILLTVVGSIIAQINPVVVKFTVNNIQSLLLANKSISDGWQIIGLISLVLIGKEILNIFVQFSQKLVGEKLKINIAQNLSNYSISKIINYSLSFYTLEENGAGRLGTRIDRGVDGLAKTIKNIFVDILPLFVSALFALVLMFNANIYVGIVSSIVVPIYFWLSVRQANIQRGVRTSLQNFKEERSNRLINIFQSIFVIKSFVRDTFESDQHKKLTREISDNEIKHHKTNYFFDSLKTFAEQIGIVSIILVTTYLVLSRQADLGAIMFHLLLFNNVTAPIRHLHRIYDEYNEAMSYAEGFFKILDADEFTPMKGNVKDIPVLGLFEVKDVVFGYSRDNPVLHNITLSIPPGKTTALVGLSGAGKTTIVNLLVKFFSPTHGSISLDGTPLEEWDDEYLRNNVGLVLQNNHIFNGSIRENISYGKLDATDAEIIDAAKQAYIHDFVEKLPQKYNTNANNLSGGQKQRLAIARIFLKNPPILILDEPTASLDAIATEQIKISLDNVKKDRTVIIISHNISQFVDADLIYVIREGKIEETGKHFELYKQNGLYTEIIQSNARSLNIGKLAETILKEK